MPSSSPSQGGVPCRGVPCWGGTLPGGYPAGGVPCWGVPCWGGTLPGGVPCWGGTLLGGTLLGGYPARGVTLPGGPCWGVPCWGGYWLPCGGGGLTSVVSKLQLSSSAVSWPYIALCPMELWVMLQSIMGKKKKLWDGYPPCGQTDRHVSKHYLPSYYVRGR